jgi:hypothetical protein
MKKSLNAITYGLSMVLAAGTVFLSSCSKDDGKDPEPENATLSFEVTELTVNEADGEVEITLSLDNPAPEDFTVEYEVSGTAREKVTNPTSGGAYDYEIVGGPGELDFDEGDETATITLKMYSDFSLESLTTPETIILSIEDVDSDKIEISRDDEMEISLKQEDGTLVALFWGPSDSETYDDVDMDLIFWAKDDGGELQPTNLASAFISEEPPEFIFFPKVFDDDTYGFSYTYYGGTADPMKFSVIFAEVIDGEAEAEEDQELFEGEYTLDNINGTWDQEGGAPLVLAQTFDMEDNVFTNFSALNIEETSSRVRTKVPAEVNRETLTEEHSKFPIKIRRK